MLNDVEVTVAENGEITIKDRTHNTKMVITEGYGLPEPGVDDQIRQAMLHLLHSAAAEFGLWYMAMMFQPTVKHTIMPLRLSEKQSAA
jgi:hypothetical protein